MDGGKVVGLLYKRAAVLQRTAAVASITLSSAKE